VQDVEYHDDGFPYCRSCAATMSESLAKSPSGSFVADATDNNKVLNMSATLLNNIALMAALFACIRVNQKFINK
jgi:hypothetical protein